jgi:serine/threonine protein kinase
MFRPPAHCPPEIQLSTFFDTSQPRASYGDAEIEDIRLLLSHCPHYAYASGSPRTYIVLRYIDHLEVLRRLVEAGVGDAWFPIGKRSLPSFLDHRVKAAILEYQSIIFTKSIDLEKGVHCYLDATEDPPFDKLKVIGSGSYGHVHSIRSKVTYKEYALKTIRRQAAYGMSARRAMREFSNEMKVMKRLEHQHVVRYIGSYTDRKDLGLVMSPIADCDLAAYLHNIRARPEFYPTLRTFYGCLATALAYLHENNIKHRDMKPSNILVYKTSVLLTDFGLSHETVDTTSGTMPGTSRYWSPEVAKAEKRNATTDVWSLGCVFVEMQAALMGCDMQWLVHWYEARGTRWTHFYANPEATQHLLFHWSATVPPMYGKPLLWIRDMLVVDRTKRSTSGQVAAAITAAEDNTRFVYSCSKCCDDWSDSDPMSTKDSDSSCVRSTKANPHTKRPTEMSRCDSAFIKPLSTINHCTEYSIEHVRFLCGEDYYTFCRPVPVIFGKCIEHILSTNGTHCIHIPQWPYLWSQRFFSSDTHIRSTIP